MNSLRTLLHFSQVPLFKARPLTTAQLSFLSSKLSLFTSSPTNPKLNYTFLFPKQNYRIIVQKMNKIGRIADEMDHHPQWTLEKGQLKVELNTHEIQGLSQKDYLLAYIIEEVMGKEGEGNEEGKVLEGWRRG